MNTFKRKKEDFVCEKCGHDVKGTGYTNHCPNCIWSKHVDIMPGDRLALLTCGGMMWPKRIEGSTGAGAGEGYSVVHECVKCKHRKKNKLAKDDREAAVFAIIKKVTNAL